MNKLSTIFVLLPITITITITVTNNNKESLDLSIHGDMEEGIFKIQPLIHDTMLESIPSSSDVLHCEVNMTSELVEFLLIQDRSPLVGTPLRFRYS